mgnify:FL=1
MCFLNNFKFATSVDLNEYLKQIKISILLHTCAPIFEIPSTISNLPADEEGLFTPNANSFKTCFFFS